MKKIRMGTKTAAGLPARLLRGLLAGFVVLLLGAVVIALMVSLEKIEYSAIGYGTVVVLLVSSFAAAAVSNGRAEEGMLLTSALSAAAMMAVLLLCNLLLFGAKFHGVAVTFLVVLAGNGAALLIGLKPEKRKKFRGYKAANR